MIRACRPVKNVGKPCEAAPHARFDGRRKETYRHDEFLVEPASRWLRQSGPLLSAARLSPTLLRTGNASKKFVQIDRYVERRLHRLLVRRYGRNLKPHHVGVWTSDWFRDQGLHRLWGTISYPGAA
jgi:hypothetical protein